MKKWLVRGVGVLVVVGAAAALIAGTALAQDDGFGGPRGHRGKGPRLIPQVAEATGLSAEDVFDELQAGKTAADILTENGVDVNTFTTELLAEMESRLAEAVANGDIDQTKADEIQADASERLTDALNNTYEFDGQRPFGGGPGGRGGHGLIGDALEATDLTAEEFRAELEAGKTPGEVLTENGVDVDSFVAEAVAEIEAKLDEAVAAGRIDQSQADEMLANAETHLEEMLDGTFEPPAEGGPGGRGRFPGGPGGRQPDAQVEGVSL